MLCIAPLEETMDDFYEMIWQSKSKLIISLSALIENKKMKMTQFWPEKEGIMETNIFNISVKTEFNENDETCIRILIVKNLIHNESREIVQLHFVGWPDNEAPKDPASVINIYHLQKKYQLEGINQNLDGPVIVHW